ncbi:transposase [Bradyrhizobium sp. 21]|nr:transposase [Bradyrhizobium sp. 21]
MTDNGSCYQSFAFRDACWDLGITHIRIKPYTPTTNGKAERFIQTALRGLGLTSDRRAQELPIWLHQSNWQRTYGGKNLKVRSAGSV